MKTEIKRRWIEALRSGRYEQTEGKLRDGDGFCCLGVLCDISGVSEWDDTGRYDGEDHTLPDSVQRWAGLGSCSPVLGPRSGYPQDVTHYNDDLGFSFEQIADLIEKHL